MEQLSEQLWAKCGRAGTTIGTALAKGGWVGTSFRNKSGTTFRNKFRNNFRNKFWNNFLKENSEEYLESRPRQRPGAPEGILRIRR